MPLNFGFQAEVFDQFQEVGLGFGHRDLTSTAPEVVQWSNTKAAAAAAAVGLEPTSVLDPRGSPSPPNSSSTLSSSRASSASGGGRGGASPPPPATQQPYDGGGGGLRHINSEFDQSMFGFILNDNTSDPSELSRLISAPSNLDSLGAIYHQSEDDFGAFSGNLQESGFGSGHGSMLLEQFGNNLILNNNVESLFNQQQHRTIESLIDHHQHHPSQNPSLHFQSGFSDQPIYSLPNPKRLNTGEVPNSNYRVEKNPFLAQNQLKRQMKFGVIN